MTLRQTIPLAATIALALHLSGCKPSTPTGEPTAPSAVPTMAQQAPAASAAASPAPQSPETPIAQPAPDLVLREWASAIEARDWAKVRALWGNDGADSGLTAPEFAFRWDKLRHPHIAIGQGQQEGAAGSLYYTAPVTITDGDRSISGEITLRRVNDVPGASAAQLRWHFDSTIREPWTSLR